MGDKRDAFLRTVTKDMQAAGVVTQTRRAEKRDEYQALQVPQRRTLVVLSATRRLSGVVKNRGNEPSD
jgi:16S rRNA G527 N7-methylase RsmG